MATTLQSPGVNVSVIDESFYTPAAPGTVPMIFVATAQNKQNASKTGTAVGTTKANAGVVYTITSQRDLTDTFGTPKFYVDQNGNPIHGGELNEYGLQAAYSFLGASSRAYIARADIDLSQLQASGTIPTGTPVSGTYWLDTGNSLFGINEWDAVNKVFVAKTPKIIDDSNSSANASSGVPKAGFGVKGDYAVVATSDNENFIWYKNQNSTWVSLGSNSESVFGSSINSSTFVSHSYQTSWPIVTSTGFGQVTGGQTFTINGQTVTIGTTSTVGIASTINATLPTYGVGAKVNASGYLELYADAGAKSNGSTADGKITLAGSALTSLGLTTGTYAAVALTIAPHTQVPQYNTTGAPTGSTYIKTTTPGKGASYVVKYYNGATQTWATVGAPIYSSAEAAIKAIDPSGGGKNVATGALFIESNYDHGTGGAVDQKNANFKIYRRSAVSPTTITGSKDITSVSIVTAPSGSATVYSFSLSESVVGSDTSQSAKQIIIATVPSSTQTVTTVVSADTILSKISQAGFTNVSGSLTSNGYIQISHQTGGEMHLTDDANNTLGTIFGFSAYNITTKLGTANLYSVGDYDDYTYRASNWKPLVFEARSSTPSTTPADGTLWYGSNFDEVDIMYHNGSTWVGYLTAFPNSDPAGPQIKATAPTKQSDGTDLVNGDIWISTASTDRYGLDVYVWNGSSLKWVAQDPTDHSSPTGWVFADARWATSGQASAPATIKALLASNYLDPDAPDPANYPYGTRLWNLRRSGFNVKKYMVNHINVLDNNGKNVRYQNDPMDGSNMTTAYFADRWVSVSPNDNNGRGTFGRLAQRSFVVASFKSLIDSNLAIRDTNQFVYNLIACPGYPEAVQNMAALNTDRQSTAFVIGDTPFRLPATGTALSNWGNNTASALDNGDEGAVTYDEYTGFFYPSGYTNDNAGNKIVVPPSHMLLRTIATSDQKSYQWFAPAGIRRGAVDNATKVGYLDNGTFVPTSLPTSIRDVMAGVKVNPIATLNGVGLVNFGNYTRAKGTSALDRINVARLTSYLRRQLDILSNPFLFEPNDKTTRDSLKNAAERLLLELVGQRALYDYIVVCDETNNTPARVDRSELWMDIAVEPVKAVEFIYIPLRLKSTGSIKQGLL